MTSQTPSPRRLSMISVVVISVAISAFAVGVPIYLWQQATINELEGQVRDLWEKLNTVQAQIVDLQTANDALEDEVEEMSLQEDLYINEDLGFMFKLPAGYDTIELENNIFQIVPEQTEEGDAVMPVAQVMVYDQTVGFSDILNEDWTLLESSAADISDLDAMYYTVNIPEYAAESECPYYFVEGDDANYAIFLYECLSWAEFEEFAESFRLN